MLLDSGRAFLSRVRENYTIAPTQRAQRRRCSGPAAPAQGLVGGGNA